ncbi:MAG: hypothetical protein II767_07565 [Proteobacteria bacterium]|nr:hypothetical protein [Pseudomonadota bacterium]
MRRSFVLFMMAGLVLSACGDEKKGEVIVSVQDKPDPVDGCNAGETGCLGNVLLTCNASGELVKTVCNGLVCGKDGEIYRCMTQDDYDNINKPQDGHDCEANWAKCVSDVRYGCDAAFHWQQVENCAAGNEVCKQVGNVAVCENEAGPEPEPKTDCEDAEKKACIAQGKACVIFGGEARCTGSTPAPQCQEGATACASNDSLKTCVSGAWNISACLANQKCGLGTNGVAACIDAPCVGDSCGGTNPSSNNVSVNFSIANKSSYSITITPRLRFILSTEGTGSEWPYNRTESVFFSNEEVMTLKSGETKSFSNVEVPGDSKQYVGQHFASRSELGEYSNNVLLYDMDFRSDTFVPQMIDPSTKFTDGATYAIVYNPEGEVTPPPAQTTGNAKVNITIDNQSAQPITISPRFRFVLSTEGTGQPYPYNRTDPAIFDNNASLTIAGGESRTFNNVEIPGDSKQYVGQHFARTDELNGYANNVLLYDTEFVSETIVPQMIDPATLFTDGGSYKIIYTSDAAPATPATGNASVNISIKNTSAQSITISPRFRFVLSTEGTGQPYPYNRTEQAVFDSSPAMTIASGETKTFNKVEIPGDSKQYIGQHFARNDELHGYANNVLLYDTEFVSDTIVPQMIDPATKFADGASYEIIYGSNAVVPPAASENVSVNLVLRNQSSHAITISPRFRFVLSTEGTGQPYPYNRTETTIFDSSDALTIASGETRTFNNIEIPGESKFYVGQHFARQDELYGYANNVLLYDTSFVSDTIVPRMIDPATKFADGATYEVIYE